MGDFGPFGMDGWESILNMGDASSLLSSIGFDVDMNGSPDAGTLFWNIQVDPSDFRGSPGPTDPNIGQGVGAGPPPGGKKRVDVKEPISLGGGEPYAYNVFSMPHR